MLEDFLSFIFYTLLVFIFIAWGIVILCCFATGHYLLSLIMLSMYGGLLLKQICG
jgi:hypothetical protein